MACAAKIKSYSKRIIVNSFSKPRSEGNLHNFGKYSYIVASSRTMVTIVGSIDNAWKRGHTTNIHHLIFTGDSILIFNVMNKKYVRKETRDYLLSDPLTLAPNTAVESYATYKDSKIQRFKDYT